MKNQIVQDLFVLLTIIFAALATTSHASPISTNPADYAIVGENGVSLNSYSTVLGDVYSRGDLNLQFGYGIQQPSQNAGNMISTGNVNVGLLSDVTGNIYANSGVSLNGDDTITGNLVYGTNYTTSSSGNVVSGTVTQAANSVPAISLPNSISFTPGTNDITTGSNLTLAPGSYGNITENGLYQNIYLSSGDYYLKSLNVLEASHLYLNVTNAPIRVFVQGNINFNGYLTAYLNGQSSGTSSLASSVLFQTGGNFNLNSPLYEFYGSVFAPSGSVSLNGNQMDGSIMSSGSVSATIYLTRQPYNWSNLPVLSIATTSATVITGGTADLGVSLTNLGISGGGAVNYALAATVSSGSLAGIQSFSQSATLAAQASQTIISMPTASANIGVNALTIVATAATAFNPVQSATASLTVLDHAAPVLSASLASTGRVMRNTANVTGSATLSNSAGNYRAGLLITSLSPGLSGPSVGNLIASGGGITVTGSINTSLTGTVSSAYTIGVSDDQTILGAATLPSLAFTVTGTVLDNRQVAAPAVTNLGFVHVGGVASQTLLLSTTGDDNHYTRVTVADSAAADANGILVSGGSPALRFGYDGMSDLRRSVERLLVRCPLAASAVRYRSRRARNRA